jgi:hypothetical protein
MPTDAAKPSWTLTMEETAIAVSARAAPCSIVDDWLATVQVKPGRPFMST